MSVVDNVKKLDVIALLTNSNSNNVQTTTIAKALTRGGNLYQRNVYFNSIANLPSFLTALFPVWLTINKNDGFNDINHCDIIVTCGRRSVRYAKHIRKHLFKNAKIVQILKPGSLISSNDVVLLPAHDKSILKSSNIIRFNGAICEKIDDEILTKTAENFSNIKEMLRGPFIGVFVGGTSKHFKFTKSLAEEFARRVNVVSKNMKMPLLISTSRRTPVDVIEIIKANLDCEYYLYNYNENPKNNPYYAFIKWSEFNIVTGDSISMISELHSAERPLYVFINGIDSRKYHIFHNYIVSNDMARTLAIDTQELEKFPFKPLNNIQELASKILSKLGL
ncbi:MAG: hypothetical protein RL208_328 [Pseudomonadota bacterium]|jgi:mitochondrial fission protein ELM1